MQGLLSAYFRYERILTVLALLALTKKKQLVRIRRRSEPPNFTCLVSAPSPQLLQGILETTHTLPPLLVTHC